jgi:hypothetical protein
MNNSILDKLEKFIEFDNKNKSSFWKFYLNSNANYKNPFEYLGFGNYTKKTLFKSFLHYILSRLTYDNNIFKSETYKNYKIVFDKSKRQINVDTIRHIFAFDLLRSINPPSNVCVIGDGKCNFVIGNLLTFPNSRIFSINLSETLINDYLILKEMKILDDTEIQVIENVDDEILSDKKLILIPSHLKESLLNKNINLFVNIASFQEMTIDEIENYFRIIKSNNSLFYCCNREYKKLVGGEELYFDNYPWGNVTKKFNEDCPWHQKIYQFRYPFIRKYDGNIKHCLIDYSK